MTEVITETITWFLACKTYDVPENGGRMCKIWR